MSVLTTKVLKQTPTSSVGLNPSTPSTWTYGSWVEAIASAAAGTVIAGIWFRSDTGRTEIELEIGVGTAGNEVGIGRFRLSMPGNQTGHRPLFLPVPLGGISTGDRVAIRVRDNGISGASASLVSLYYFEAFDGPSLTELTNTAAGTDGTSLTPNGTAWANSSWVELTSGFAETVSLYGITLTQPIEDDGLMYEVDIGIGAAGAETVIATTPGSHTALPGPFKHFWLPKVYVLSASTRVAVRLRKSSTDTTAWRAALLYYNDVPNALPVVNAGVDQAFTWPQNITNLNGSATDADGTIASYAWSKVSGPGTVTFGDATAAATTAVFSTFGTYVIRLAATDDLGGVGEDTLIITIADPTAEIEFPPEENVNGTTIGLTWREIYHVDAAGNDKVFLAAPVDLNDPLFYYGGYKPARVLSWGEYVRAASDDRGNYESPEFTWVESDTDRLIRGWMGNQFQQYIQNRQVITRMIDDASRRLFVTPRTLMRGIIRGYKPIGPLHYQFRAQDFLTSLFGPANLQKQIPQEAISRAQFPSCPTESLHKPVPYLFGNLSNSISSTVPPTLTGTPSTGFYDDGGGALVAGFGSLTSLAAVPTGVSTVAGAGGSGTLGTTVDYYNAEVGAMVTAVDANGDETDPEPFYSDGPHGGSRGSFANAGTITAATIDGTKKVTVSWTAAANAVKYRVYIGYYYFGFRPTLMKEVTAPTVSVDFTSDTDGNSPSFTQFWWYAVSAVMPDGETGLSQQIFSMVRTHRRPTLIEWNAVPSATAYRIYRRGIGDWDRKWEVAAPATSFEDDLLDTGATFITGLAQLTGVIPVTPIGIEYDDANSPWFAFLVCGHQVHEISAVYQDGVVIDSSQYGVNLLVPGQTGYSTFFSTHTGSPQYHTVNGRIYTKIYARSEMGATAADGTKPFSINVKGRRSEGGTFLEQIADIYREFVLNFGFQDGAGGYLSNPEWPEDIQGDTLTQIDLDSFDYVKDVHAARLVGGYPGGIAFGADGNFITLREAIAQLNVSADTESFFDRNSRFKVSIFNEDLALVSAARHYTQLTDILKGEFDLDPKVDEVENIVVYSYRRNYYLPPDGRRWDIEEAEEEDSTSISNLREEKRSRVLELHGIRTAGPATDIAVRRKVRKSVPPVIVELKTNLYGLSTEIGDVIRVTHIDGATSSGWTLRTLRVKRHITNPQNYTVRLICEDVQRLYDFYNP